MHLQPYKTQPKLNSVKPDSSQTQTMCFFFPDSVIFGNWFELFPWMTHLSNCRIKYHSAGKSVSVSRQWNSNTIQYTQHVPDMSRFNMLECIYIGLDKIRMSHLMRNLVEVAVCYWGSLSWSERPSCTEGNSEAGWYEKNEHVRNQMHTLWANYVCIPHAFPFPKSCMPRQNHICVRMFT